MSSPVVFCPQNGVKAQSFLLLRTAKCLGLLHLLTLVLGKVPFVGHKGVVAMVVRKRNFATVSPSLLALLAWLNDSKACLQMKRGFPGCESNSTTQLTGLGKVAACCPSRNIILQSSRAPPGLQTEPVHASQSQSKDKLICHMWWR